MWLGEEPVADFGFATAALSGELSDWLDLLCESALPEVVHVLSPPPLVLRLHGFHGHVALRHPRGECSTRAPPA